MEEKALETMGENKASYLMKGSYGLLYSQCMLTIFVDQISKMPASDQQDVKELQQGLGNVLGGGLQNPLGKEAGNFGDELSSPLTGR